MSHPLTTFLRFAPTQSRRLLVLALCVIIAIALAPGQVTHAVTSVTVTSSADGIAPPGCTLRAAVQAINTMTSVGGCTVDGSTNTILFQAGLGPITLTTGELAITTTMTITGNGANV